MFRDNPLMMMGAIACAIIAIICGGIGFTGVMKGLAGTAKALFFGFIGLSAILAAAGFFAAKKLGG